VMGSFMTYTPHQIRLRLSAEGGRDSWGMRRFGGGARKKQTKRKTYA
jgi:hypothetical protein